MFSEMWRPEVICIAWFKSDKVIKQRFALAVRNRLSLFGFLFRSLIHLTPFLPFFLMKKDKVEREWWLEKRPSSCLTVHKLTLGPFLFSIFHQLSLGNNF